MVPGGRQALIFSFVLSAQAILQSALPNPSGAPGALFILPFNVHKSSKELVIKFFCLQFASDSLPFKHCLASLKHYTLAIVDFGLT